MKKKILLTIILTFVLIFTSGCNVNYTLKYEDDTFYETLNVQGKNEDDAHPTYTDILENGLFADIKGKEYFEPTASSSKYDVTLNHTLQDVTLKELKTVSECFTLSTYKEAEGSYYMYLHGDFTCTYLEDSTFTLETDADVIIENAHRKSENKYIWDLDEDALGDKGIKFQILKSTVEEEAKKTSTMLPIGVTIVFGIIIAGAGVGLVLLLKKQKER